MSDALGVAIVSGIVSIATLVIQLKMKAKVETVDKKLDENHAQQNGNLTKLLETTKELATAKEKEKHPRKS